MTKLINQDVIDQVTKLADQLTYIAKITDQIERKMSPGTDFEIRQMPLEDLEELDELMTYIVNELAKNNDYLLREAIIADTELWHKCQLKAARRDYYNQDRIEVDKFIKKIVEHYDD